jgi:putative membrane protein
MRHIILNTSAFLGMDPIWWIVFFVILVWIFIVPFDIPGQRRQKDSPLEILKKRFASGDITAEEFKRDSNLLLRDPGNKLPITKK